jgi:hypothetical protein
LYHWDPNNDKNNDQTANDSGSTTRKILRHGSAIMKMLRLYQLLQILVGHSGRSQKMKKWGVGLRSNTVIGEVCGWVVDVMFLRRVEDKESFSSGGRVTLITVFERNELCVKIAPSIR